MWHFDARGFISVVAYDPKKDRNKSSKFSSIAKEAGTHLLIRARIKEDLDMVKETVPSLHIETDAGADYAYRAVITRSQFKKFLADSVDKVDYDSHFKEAARDRSPAAQGRYQAMMSIWSAMAKLQPIAPWSGSSWASYGGKSSSKSKSSSGSLALANGVPKRKSPQSFATMEDYLKAVVTLTAKPHLKGTGARTGFGPGDDVEGYFGVGQVVKVEPAKAEGGQELVRVKFIKDNKEVQSIFVSHFLTPLKVGGKEVPVPGQPKPKESVDLDSAFNRILKIEKFQYPVDELPTLTFTALEFVIRLAEIAESDEEAEFSSEVARNVYEEVMWESATDEEKLAMANEGTVPEKFAAEVSNLSSAGS